MPLLKTIEQDYVAAFKSGDKIVVLVLRSLKTAIKNAEIEKRGKGEEGAFSDEEAAAVVKRQVKQLEEAKEMFAQGGRQDLVDQNEKEIAVLKKYLPVQASEEQVREIVKKVVGEMGKVAPADFGRVMGAVMKELKGKADGAEVGKVVKEMLENQ